MSKNNGKLIISCLDCGRKGSTGRKEYTCKKCGSNNVIIDDQWDSLIESYMVRHNKKEMMEARNG